MTNKDWIIEQVKIIPLDDGQIKMKYKYRSYLIYRENSLDNSTSFILDLKLNRNFNPNIPIEYENEEIQSNTSKCLFYTGSVRHWKEDNSLVAISICESLVSFSHLFLFYKQIKIHLDWFYSPYTIWY